MKKTKDVLISASKKFCLVGLRKRSIFDGRENAPVVTAHAISNLSNGYIWRILTKTLTAHQIFDTLSSKIPLPTGNSRLIICFTLKLRKIRSWLVIESSVFYLYDCQFYRETLNNAKLFT